MVKGVGVPTLDVGDGVGGAEIVVLIGADTDVVREGLDDAHCVDEGVFVRASVTVNDGFDDGDTVPEAATDDVRDTDGDALGDDTPDRAGESEDATLRDVRCVPSMEYSGDSVEAREVLGDRDGCPVGSVRVDVGDKDGNSELVTDAAGHTVGVID